MHEQLNAYQIWKYQQDLWEVHCALSIVFCKKRFPFDICCSKLTIETLEQDVKYVQS